MDRTIRVAASADGKRKAHLRILENDPGFKQINPKMQAQLRKTLKGKPDRDIIFEGVAEDVKEYADGVVAEAKRKNKELMGDDYDSGEFAEELGEIAETAYNDYLDGLDIDQADFTQWGREKHEERTGTKAWW